MRKAMRIPRRTSWRNKIVNFIIFATHGHHSQWSSWRRQELVIWSGFEGRQSTPIQIDHWPDQAELDAISVRWYLHAANPAPSYYWIYYADQNLEA